MPSQIEVKIEQQDWVDLPSIQPGQQPASFSDKASDSVIVIECSPDDSHTRVWKSILGLSGEIGQERLEISFEKEELAVLRLGEHCELEAITPRDLRISIRITHVES